MTREEIIALENDVIALRNKLRTVYQHSQIGNIKNSDRDFAATLWHNMLLLMPRIQQNAEELQKHFDLS